MKMPVAAIAVCLALAARANAAPAPLGEVAFANSCTAMAQAPFLRGLALLHNFEYADAADAFQAAEKADPACAIAVWGEAMTFNHPVWLDQDAEAGRRALARLGTTPAIRLAKAGTPREAAYLQAVETLYGAGSKRQRDTLYAARMADLHRRFPDDVDATAFTALSLLGTAHDGRDIPTYMRAAALLEEVFPTHQHHPGVLHYMIHSYDDPAHAPLGMRAARLYSAIAAGAPHALHMTSHIFIALGMWDEVIAANQAAMQAVNQRAAAAHVPLAACGHYAEWLVYGYLQERRFADAQAAIGHCRDVAQAKLATRPQPAFPSRSPVLSHADMMTRAALETGAWRPDAALTLDDGGFVEARFDQAYAAALAPGKDAGAARLTDAVGVMRTSLGLLRGRPPGADEEGGQEQARIWAVMLEQAEAMRLRATGDVAAAIGALRSAAQHETGLPTEFGPPAVPKPPFELLGDVLMQAGNAGEAAEAYRMALVRAPGRTLSVQGLAAAQAKIGDRDGGLTIDAQ